MSVSARILSGTMWLAAANVLARAGTFLGNLIVIRYLGLELVGQLGLIESWLTLVTMFSIAGLGVAATRHVAAYLSRDVTRVGGLATTALVLSAGLGLLLALLLTLWSTTPADQATTLGFHVPAFLATTQQILGEHKAVLAWLVVVTTIGQVATGLVYGLQSYRGLVYLNLVLGLAGLPMYYFFVRWGGLTGVLYVRLLMGLLQVCVLVWIVRSALHHLHAAPSLRGFGTNAHALAALGIPTFVGELVANPVQSIALSFLAAQPGGVAQVGLITTASRLVGLAGFAPAAMATAITPVLSGEWGHDDMGRFGRSLTMALRMMWLASLPIVIFLMAATPVLLTLLYGPTYTAAASVAVILLASVLLGGINQVGDRAFVAANRAWLSTLNNLIWAVLFVILAGRLIPSRLAVGYATAYLVSFALYTVVQMGWLQRLFGLAVKPLAGLAVVSAAFLFGASFMASASGPAMQFVSGAFLSLSACWVLWRWFLAPDERQVVRRYVSQRSAGAQRRLAHWKDAVNLKQARWAKRR